MQIVEEMDVDDPYYDGMVTSCPSCRKGLVLILPNYFDNDMTFYNCSEKDCELHREDGPTI